MKSLDLRSSRGRGWGRGVSEKEFERFFLCIPSIVDLVSILHIEALPKNGLVEDLARKWVLKVVSNVFIGQIDKLVARNAIWQA